MRIVEGSFRYIPVNRTERDRLQSQFAQTAAGAVPKPARARHSVEIVCMEKAGEHADEWNALADRAVEPNPFYRPGALLPIIAYLQPDSPRLLFIRTNGRLTGILPLVNDRAGFGISGKRPALYFHQYGPVGAPIIDRDFVDDTLAALFPAETESTSGTPGTTAQDIPAGILVHLDENGPIFRSLVRIAEKNGRPPVVLNRFQRAALDAEQDREHFLKQSLVRKKRKDLARLFRRMQDQGKVVIFTHRQPPDIAGALERFIALETRGWKGRRESALGSETDRTQFALELVNNFAANGQARIDEITVNGLLVASLISFIDGNRLFTWKIAHREEFARFSPGTQIIVKLSEALLADPSIALADSLATPDHPMIDHIWRDRISFAKAYVPLRRPGVAAAACMRADERAYSFAKAAAKQLIAKAKTQFSKTR